MDIFEVWRLERTGHEELSDREDEQVGYKQLVKMEEAIRKRKENLEEKT